MSQIRITEATLVAPEHPLHLQSVDIHISDGLIDAITPVASTPHPAEATVIVHPNLHVSAGWVDSHVVLSDPGFEQRETLEQLGRAARAGGFTDVIALPNTNPALDNAQAVRALLQRAQGLGANLHVMGAASMRCQGEEMSEMLELLAVGALAISDGLHPIQDVGMLGRCMQYLSARNGLLVQMPVLKAIEGGGIANESPEVTKLGLKMVPHLAETLMVQQSLMLAAYHTAKLHLSPITLAASLQVIQDAKKSCTDVSVSTFAPYLLLTDSTLSDFDPRYKFRPPLRQASDSNALIQALANGTIDCIASGHAAATIDEKRLEFDFASFGVPMMETCFAAARTATESQVPLTTLIQALTTGPRTRFGLPEVTLQEGSPACLTLFQPDVEWTIPANITQSPYNANPLTGTQVKGAVVGTILHKQIHL